MSVDAQSIASQLKSAGLLRTQGLIGGKWRDAYDGKTLKVCHTCCYSPCFSFYSFIGFLQSLKDEGDGVIAASLSINSADGHRL